MKTSKAPMETITIPDTDDEDAEPPVASGSKPRAGPGSGSGTPGGQRRKSKGKDKVVYRLGDDSDVEIIDSAPSLPTASSSGPPAPAPPLAAPDAEGEGGATPTPPGVKMEPEEDANVETTPRPADPFPSHVPVSEQPCDTSHPLDLSPTKPAQPSSATGAAEIPSLPSPESTHEPEASGSNVKTEDLDQMEMEMEMEEVQVGQAEGREEVVPAEDDVAMAELDREEEYLGNEEEGNDPPPPTAGDVEVPPSATLAVAPIVTDEDEGADDGDADDAEMSESDGEEPDGDEDYAHAEHPPIGTTSSVKRKPAGQYPCQFCDKRFKKTNYKVLHERRVRLNPARGIKVEESTYRPFIQRLLAQRDAILAHQRVIGLGYLQNPSYLSVYSALSLLAHKPTRDERMGVYDSYASYCTTISVPSFPILASLVALYLYDRDCAIQSTIQAFESIRLAALGTWEYEHLRNESVKVVDESLEKNETIKALKAENDRLRYEARSRPVVDYRASSELSSFESDSEGKGESGGHRSRSVLEGQILRVSSDPAIVQGLVDLNQRRQSILSDQYRRSDLSKDEESESAVTLALRKYYSPTSYNSHVDPAFRAYRQFCTEEDIPPFPIVADLVALWLHDYAYSRGSLFDYLVPGMPVDGDVFESCAAFEDACWNAARAFMGYNTTRKADKRSSRHIAIESAGNLDEIDSEGDTVVVPKLEAGKRPAPAPSPDDDVERQEEREKRSKYVERVPHQHPAAPPLSIPDLRKLLAALSSLLDSDAIATALHRFGIDSPLRFSNLIFASEGEVKEALQEFESDVPWLRWVILLKKLAERRAEFGE
ncbi:hypothetical protein RQP46_001320 [Phenoliferia psychrophenolica]